MFYKNSVIIVRAWELFSKFLKKTKLWCHGSVKKGSSCKNNGAVGPIRYTIKSTVAATKKRKYAESKESFLKLGKKFPKKYVSTDLEGERFFAAFLTRSKIYKRSKIKKK